jgi:hypothetical protein
LKKSTVAVLFPDGISVRNFLYSKFPEYLLEKHQIVVFSFLPDAAFDFLQQDVKRRLVIEKLVPFHEPFFSKVFRYGKQYAQLKLNYKSDSNESYFRCYPDLNKQHWRNKITLFFGKVLGTFFATQKGVLLLEKGQYTSLNWFRSPLIKQYQKLLKKHDCQLVFCPQQRDVKVPPLLLAAEQLKIPRLNFIYSWDNLPKGRFAIKADYFAVWSNRMKAEMGRYVPDVSQEKVFVTGTPQFEFFTEERVWSKEEFFDFLGINPNKPLILYSGDAIDASPYDQHYFEDVAKSLAEWPEDQRPNLVIRPTPFDLSGRFDAVVERYSFVTMAEPLWLKEDKHFMNRVATPDDMILLANFAYHADLAINFGSTLCHDFSMFGTSVAYLNYDHPNINPDYWNADFFYSFTHFESMKGLQPVHWINSVNEISSVIKKALDDPEMTRTDAVLWRQLITDDPLQASEKIAALCSHIIDNSPKVLHT